MKIVIAPDKFKGSLSAAKAAAAIARGVRRALPAAQISEVPMADGGEGTVDALVASTGGRFESRRVTGPLPEMKVDARFGILGDGETAVIEMSAASGLALLKPEDRNPLNTTTFGTGELLVAAAQLGVKSILLGIGGSATVDAGLGCAQACGLPIILDDGGPVSLTEPLCGRDIASVRLIKHGRGSALDRVKITVACDVSNPLYGPNGAAYVFGPQKGATPEQVRQLDEALEQLAHRLGKSAESQIPGAGAAGGLGFGMIAYFGAQLRSGIQMVIDAAGLEQHLAGADLCITGEGRLDTQTLSGKTPIGVASLCKRLNIPCIVLAGSIDPAAQPALSEHFTACLQLANQRLNLEQSMKQAAPLLEEAAETAARVWTSPTPKA